MIGALAASHMRSGTLIQIMTGRCRWWRGHYGSVTAAVRGDRFGIRGDLIPERWLVLRSLIIPLRVKTCVGVYTTADRIQRARIGLCFSEVYQQVETNVRISTVSCMRGRIDVLVSMQLARQCAAREGSQSGSI